jgi:hypothetical protein
VSPTNVSQNFIIKKRSYIFRPIYKGIKKGKAIPVQGRTGPEGSRRLRLPEFMTIGT